MPRTRFARVPVLLAALAAVALPALPSRSGQMPDSEPRVTYVAGNISLAEALRDLFTAAGREFRLEGALPARTVTAALSGVPLSSAVQQLARQSGAALDLRIVDGVYHLKWSALPGEPAPPPALPGPSPVPAPDIPPRPVVKFRTTADGVVVVPMTFPVLGKTQWTDTFNPSGGGGRRRHHGQDLMAPKLRPLVATFDGVVYLAARRSHNMLYVRGDCGYTAAYMHINNDTPGTDDGRHADEYAYAAGLRSGDRVREGQLVAWVGDSGNAENTGPHCHFELTGPEGHVNPAPSLRAARRILAPVAVVPLLDERAGPGEMRWDGVVREFRAAEGIAVLDVAAIAAHGKASKAVTAPLRQWLRLRNTRVRLLAAPGKDASGGTLRPGDRVSVIGEAPKAGRAAVVTLAVLHDVPPASDVATGSGQVAM